MKHKRSSTVVAGAPEASLIAMIQSYLAITSETVAGFGLAVAGDKKFLYDLMGGRSVERPTRLRILEHMISQLRELITAADVVRLELELEVPERRA